MKIGLVTVAYREARFMPKFLGHIPDWVGEKLVLVSTTPWHGQPVEDDSTAAIARDNGATVIEYDWPNEESQRNAGQEYFSDCDWVVILDPDEFLSNKAWEILWDLIWSEDLDERAYIVNHQRVFYKDKEVASHNDYKQLILVRPEVRFWDKRVVNSAYDVLPITLLHFSWARTDYEVWNKISHYAHAHDFDTRKWYQDVWLANKRSNLHPVDPEVLPRLIKAKLPPEIEKLDLFP